MQKYEHHAQTKHTLTVKELLYMLRVTVSFKNTSKDVELYTRIKALEEQSEVIKKAIRFYFKHLENEGEE